MRLALLFAWAAPAFAAGLTATPSVVNWSYVSGSHNYPSQRISLVSSSGAAAYNATSNSENGWLLVNAGYVSSSATLSVGAYLTPASQIDRLDSGSYQGTVNFTDSDGNTAAVTVNLTITGSGNPNPGITLNPPVLNFTSALNGPPQAQNVTVTGPTAGMLQVRDASGSFPGWLQAVVTGAAGSYTVVVTIFPGSLGAGSYHEDLLFSIGGATATLPVIVMVQQQSILTATPAALAFDYTPGGAPPQPAAIQVRSTGANLQFSAAFTVQSGNWLQVSPASGTTPATVLVTPQVEGLAPGLYTGSVLITPQQGAPLNIPVSLTLRPTPVIAASSGSLSFSYQTGSAVPAPLPVQITGAGMSPTFTVQVAGGDWLAATADRSIAPAVLTVAVKPASLAPATYNGLITVTGTGTAKGVALIGVTLQVLAAAPANVTVAKVVNAAGYQEGGIAPGEIVAIFGTNLAPAGTVTLVLDAAGKVAATLGGVQVLFNGTPGPMVYTTPGQIAAVAPYELDGRAQTTVQVVNNGQASNTLVLPVTAAVPGIFTADASGAGLAAATPASAGGAITLWLTGEGQTAPRGQTGQVTAVAASAPLTPAPVLPLSATIGGLPADYTFAGEAPGMVAGVLQLNLTVPRGLSAGNYPVLVTIGGKSTQPGVLVTVR